MSQITYNSNRLIPAPFVSINKTYDTTGDTERLGAKITVTMEGTIVAFAGSPYSDGTWYTGSDYPADEVIVADARLDAIMKKQDAIRELFATEGQLFVIKSADGTTTLSGYPRIMPIEFQSGPWYNKSTYTISLEFDEINPEVEDTFSEFIVEGSESWGIETDEGRPEGIDKPYTYKMIHNIEAVGKRHYTGSTVRPAWKEARDWVQSRLGYDTYIALASGSIDISSDYSGYNHIVNENVGETNGTYSVMEQWVISTGNFLEDLLVTNTHNASNSINPVTVAGTIIGLDGGASKYDSAVQGFSAASGSAFTRAQSYSGRTLNINPLTSTIGHNEITGVINYNMTFDNRPYNIIPGAFSEVVSVNDNVNGGDAFAELFILGRTWGPVLQSLGTQSSYKRSLNIEIVVVPPSSDSSVASIYNSFYDSNPRNNAVSSGAIENIITAINPSYKYGKVFSDPAQETWDFKTGRYSYNHSWTYQPSG